MSAFPLAALDWAGLLGHHWAGDEHVLLALLDGPPRASLAPRSSISGSTSTPRSLPSPATSSAWPTSAPAVSSATERILERARVKARQRRDEEPSSEHVLLVLSEEWENAQLLEMVAGRGVGAEQVRVRVLADGTRPPTPAPELRPWPETGPVLLREQELALSPAGHDPWRRRPWGSVMFRYAAGATFRQGAWIRQYFVDRDGYPVLTADGRPVHVLVDEDGRPVQDDGGRSVVGPVDIPPGCEVRAVPR